jgi:dipeptidase D
VAKFRVTGLQGGQSGLDIDKKRVNAIKLLSSFLSMLRAEITFELAAIRAGNRQNAIPREAEAVLVFSNPSDFQSTMKWIEGEARSAKEQFARREPGLTITFEPIQDTPVLVMDSLSQSTLLTLLLAIPHGVEEMSPDIEGLVQTSNNLATVSAENGLDAGIETMARSSVKECQEAIEEKIVTIAVHAGATAQVADRYPGWQPDMKSSLLAKAGEAYRSVAGREPEIKAVHAGLECGIIKDKFPEMDMISIGPDIRGAHSPSEKVNVRSVGEFWQVFVRLIESL